MSGIQGAALIVDVSESQYKQIMGGDVLYAVHENSLDTKLPIYGVGIAIDGDEKEGAVQAFTHIQLTLEARDYLGFPVEFLGSEQYTPSGELILPEMYLQFRRRESFAGGYEDMFHGGSLICLELMCAFPVDCYESFEHRFSMYIERVDCAYQRVFKGERPAVLNLELKKNEEVITPLSIVASLLDTTSKPGDGPFERMTEGRSDNDSSQLESKTRIDTLIGFEVKDTGISYGDISGLEKQKELLQLAAHCFLHPEFALGFGIDPAKNGNGILIHGPSGCGKTMLAKALATELKGEDSSIRLFFPDYGSDMASIYRGGESIGVSRLFRSLYGLMDKGARVMLCLDEIQPISQRRDPTFHSNESLDQLLIEVPKFLSYGSGLLVASTAQQLYTLDSQIIRPGRFGWITSVDMPDIEQAKGILELTVSKRIAVASERGKTSNRFAEEIDYQTIAQRVPGIPSVYLVLLIDSAIRDRMILEMKGNPFKQITTEDILAHVPDLIKRMDEQNNPLS